MAKMPSQSAGRCGLNNMARRNETVWCSIFDELQLSGLSRSIIKLRGAPIYVFQVRAVPPVKWTAVILRRHAEPLIAGDSAEACKAAIEAICSGQVNDWQEGYWDGDTWQPKTSRPAPIHPLATREGTEKLECDAYPKATRGRRKR